MMGDQNAYDRLMDLVRQGHEKASFVNHCLVRYLNDQRGNEYLAGIVGDKRRSFAERERAAKGLSVSDHPEWPATSDIDAFYWEWAETSGQWLEALRFLADIGTEYSRPFFEEMVMATAFTGSSSTPRVPRGGFLSREAIMAARTQDNPLCLAHEAIRGLTHIGSPDSRTVLRTVATEGDT
ncbi:MAG TPA: hypothetical protein HPP77_01215, partial [Candidatus Hydrogenedentes bacterium]|nr:hypothetical protein [Candidatus Hydrogenedentota bacterium]